MKEVLLCAQCGTFFKRKKGTRKHTRVFCSTDCYHTANRGAGCIAYEGGRWFEKSKGYMMLTMPDGKHRAEHIVIAEKSLGRRMKKGEVVHHINGNKLDNRNCNLLICTKAYHTALHHAMSMKYAALLEV